jgi:hypothetical protein
MAMHVNARIEKISSIKFCFVSYYNLWNNFNMLLFGKFTYPPKKSMYNTKV